MIYCKKHDILKKCNLSGLNRYWWTINNIDEKQFQYMTIWTMNKHDQWRRTTFLLLNKTFLLFIHLKIRLSKFFFITFFFFTGAIRTMAVLDLESKSHYWLTVCAQDQAVVPLHSCVQVKYFMFYFFLLRFLYVLWITDPEQILLGTIWVYTMYYLISL